MRAPKPEATAPEMAQVPPGPRMVRRMFNTGSGKAVSISEEGLAKAQQEMQAIVPTTQGVNGSGTKFENLAGTR